MVAEAALGEGHGGDGTPRAAGDRRRLAVASGRNTGGKQEYLLDVARVYVLAGDMLRAGRAVLEAERTARRVRCTTGRRYGTWSPWWARSAAAPADLARLAATLGVA